MVNFRAVGVAVVMALCWLLLVEIFTDLGTMAITPPDEWADCPYHDCGE